MNFSEPTTGQLLTKIEDKQKVMNNMVKQLTAITP